MARASGKSRIMADSRLSPSTLPTGKSSYSYPTGKRLRDTNSTFLPPTGSTKTMQLTRREALKATALTPLALIANAQSAARPNIVFILADDLGYADVSCYGRRDFTTPNIDRIAAEGMKFTQAYANSAVCSATRTALITGRYQYRLPIVLEEPLGSGEKRIVGLPPSHPTLPSLLKKAGYGATLIGKWHLGKLPDFGPLKRGYDHFWGFGGGGLDFF